MTESVPEAVGRLLPAIAAAADDVDAAGALDPGIVAGLRAAGVFRLLQPRAFGGCQSDPADYLAVIGEIARACTSTGWLASMLSVNAWHLALFDDQAQRDVWGADPTALLSASYAPTGRLEHVRGGFRLSGRWSRCTGIAHASWVLVAALVVSGDGAAEDFTVAAVPCADYTVEKSWNALGLRGIGADDVVISGAFVPAHRTFSWVGEVQRSALDPLYRLPQPTLYNHAGTVPVLGAAQGVLAARTDPEPLSALALAAAEVELSPLQLRRNLAEVGACVAAQAAVAPELMLRVRRDQVLAFDRAMKAVQLLVRRPGGVDERRLERVWRDIQTARAHVANDVDRVLAVVGEFAFGLPVDDFMV